MKPKLRRYKVREKVVVVYELERVALAASARDAERSAGKTASPLILAMVHKPASVSTEVVGVSR